jgi:hypothetical protein
VDDDDAALFDAAFGSHQGDANYRWHFDFGGDGDIDFSDLLAFRDRLGTLLPP